MVRSSKKPSVARARGRARRWGNRRPVMSDSASTATLLSGRMKPLERAAVTTTAPGEPLAASRVGACIPPSPSTTERRSAPGAVAAHSVTE